MGSQCKARRRCLAGCQARSRNAAMGAQWPEPGGLRPNGPATALRSLPRALAIGRVARLVAEPFGHNAIPRRECQQTLVSRCTNHAAFDTPGIPDGFVAH